MSVPLPELRPLSIRKDGDDRLTIEWNDGHRSVHTWPYLRKSCPCASCREERDKPPDPFRILSGADLVPKAPIKPVSMTPLGHYAYKIVWNDGHDTGLYTLENLRALCECPECRTMNSER